MIEIRIAYAFGAVLTSDEIFIGYRRANSRYRFNDEYLEENIEWMLEHEVVHIVLNRMWKYPIGKMVSWLFDIIEYQTEVVKLREIPFKFKSTVRRTFSKRKRKKIPRKLFQKDHLFQLAVYRRLCKSGEDCVV